MGNENIIPDNYYMCLNLIGESMDQFLYCISNNTCESYANQRTKKSSLYDYWDYLYNPMLDFFGQLAITMNRLKIQKDSLTLNYKECLIIRIKNIESIEIQYVFEKINNLNREHYVPLILFLCDEYEENDLEKFIFNENKYSKIDKRMIYFEKYEADIINEEKMRKIKYRLERFCSYFNELGDRFSIGKNENLNDYDLTEMNFPFTVNICCVGRFGKGKSTGVNVILGEKNAKENKSGASETSKINYYQVSNFPVKIYDFPGFENTETIFNTIKQFKYLNEEIRQIQDQIHIFLYFIKSTDERMFTEMEYKIFSQIIKHKDSYVLYVLTHSSEKTDKSEVYDMINTGIKGVIESKKRKKELITQKDTIKFKNIYMKMFATAENCIFVNFHKTNKLPLYGISNFFNKIAIFTERTKAYKRFKKSSYLTEEEYERKIIKEAKIRKLRAKALISRHKIGSGIAGFLPGADYFANKYYIKKDAARKAGQIFGFDLKNLEESIKSQKIKLEKKKKNRQINDNEAPHLSIIEDEDDESEEEDSKKKENSNSINIGRGAMYSCTFLSYSTGIPRYLLSIGGVGLIAVSAVFSVVGSAIGYGVGYYIMKKHCEELLNQFELLFLENAEKISDSLLLGINYLKNVANLYKEQGF